MICLDTDPGTSSKPNEDWIGATSGQSPLIVVLDGLSTPGGLSGPYTTPWYTSRLGTLLLQYAAEPSRPLVEALGLAIAEVTESMGVTQGATSTPSSTVAIARQHWDEDRLDVLVLADSPVVMETTEGVNVIVDTRVDDVVPAARDAALSAPTGSQEKQQLVAELVDAQRVVRNAPGGYWIAQTSPEAAHQALTAEWRLSDVQRLAVMTDGASRLVDTYDLMTWQNALDLLSAQGPRGLIQETRAAESKDPNGTLWPRYKRSDDASVAFWEPR